MSLPLPNLFQAHRHLSDRINHNIIQSEIDGGVFVRDLTRGQALEIETHDCRYTFVYRGDGLGLLSGHPCICPEPVMVAIQGSTWGGSMLKTGFIGRGMHLEFHHPRLRTVLTSVVVDIRAAQAAELAA